MPSILSVTNLCKRFSPGAPPVVDGLSFSVNEGEIFALLGPSGCGKTTTLRLIAGFETPDAGEVVLKESMLAGPTTRVPPEKRGIGIVFQDFALFPHLTVEQNVAFGLRSKPSSERKRVTRDVLRLVGLAGLESRRPQQLSGGQQQRVAVARSLATAPDVILMDEPFSNLDALLRQSTRDEIREVLKKTGMTAILVTHDQEEALSFADRVALMWNGQIEQVGTPEQIYFEPRTLFAAQFLGRTNLVLSSAVGDKAETPVGTVALNRHAVGDVLLSIRPEHLLIEAASDEPGAVDGTVAEKQFRGHDVTYRVVVSGSEYLVHMQSRSAFEPGDRVSVRVMEPAVVLHKRA